jgi:hypothetical protein
MEGQELDNVQFTPDEPAANICPACAASLSPEAVLCIACGYHLKLKTYLATHVERETSAAIAPRAADLNPYAAPAADLGLPISGIPEFDLTETAAKRAKAIADEAEMVKWVILVSGICFLPWIIAFPWYLIRLLSWYRLHNEYAELRYPNAFSPHGNLPVHFQAGWKWLVAGVMIGGFWWLVFGSLTIAPLVLDALS